MAKLAQERADRTRDATSMTYFLLHHLDACNTSPAGGSDHISAARFGDLGVAGGHGAILRLMAA
jgi:hypothetical protein